MVVHVCEQAAKADRVERVVVATDAHEIAEAVRGHGFEAVTTGEHDNGTSRVAEAAETLKLSDESIIINVQGDEPEIEPETIAGAVEALVYDRFRFAHEVGTVVSAFRSDESLDNPNVVKVALGDERDDDQIGHALFFSRSVIPFNRDPASNPVYFKHVGIYAFRHSGLRVLAACPQTRLERIEKLEQLRWLELGHRVLAAIRPTAHHGIDTPQQYAAFVERYRAANRA